jgi:hypothetical protein
MFRLSHGSISTGDTTMKPIRFYQSWLAFLKGYSAVYYLLMGFAVALILLSLPALAVGDGQPASAAEAGGLLWVVRLLVFLAGAVIVGRALSRQTRWPRRQHVRQQPVAVMEVLPAVPRPTRIARTSVAEGWSEAAR